MGNETPMTIYMIVPSEFWHTLLIKEGMLAMFLFYQNIEFTKDYLDKVLEEVLLKDTVK